MAIKQNIKNNVQKYRVWKGLLQEDLAQLTGISLSQIALIEKQRATPRKATMEKLIQFFDLSYDQLFYKDD